jgi:formate transporter
MNQGTNLDALLPQEIAQKAETIGVRKANSPFFTVFVLAILAGAFVALGAVFATVIITGTNGVIPYGIARVLMGLAFCLGLILIVLSGAELFTGNNLVVMAWASKKITTKALLLNWGIVYLGNFTGSILSAILIVASGISSFNGGAVGKTMLTIANTKVHYGFWQALMLGIFCNALVCLAIWMTFGARTTTDKILAVIFPITAFVTVGFEHSVANMYFIPAALLIKDFQPAITASAGLDLGQLTWGTFFFNNLLPVTIGNLIGGAVLVGLVYWSVYLRNRTNPD